MIKPGRYTGFHSRGNKNMKNIGMQLGAMIAAMLILSRSRTLAQ